MDSQQLQEMVTETAQRLDVPGVAVGVYSDGAEQYAFHGITSIENPLPVEENTLFQFGSTGKTYTATAMLRLVEQGLVDLNEPVRRYVPELVLKDQETAERVTVLQLFNHSAGWAGDFFGNTGDGEDALARYVDGMADLEQVTPLGSAVSYNNAALSLAGRVIEKVTGKTYEQAIRELVFEPLGLEHSFFFPNEVMTRRFVVGHNQHPDGKITIHRQWALSRGGNPAGGISSNAGDLVAWARFHLGDGTAADGERVLSAELLDRMKQPTMHMPGSALGDAVGISWFLRDIDNAVGSAPHRVRLVSHGGDTIGQHSDYVLVPERQFGITVMTNCGPNGGQFNDEVRKWALAAYAGVEERDPEPVVLPADRLADYVGTYDTIAVVCRIAADGGRLRVTTEPKAHVLTDLGIDPSDIDDTPIPLALLAADGDRYIVPDGSAKGMKGHFIRVMTARSPACTSVADWPSGLVEPTRSIDRSRLVAR